MASEEQNIKRMTPKELARATTGPTVHVVVGSKRRSYHVHAELLKYHSSWFENHFKNLCNEKIGTVYEFPDIDVRTFDQFEHYLYSQALSGCEDFMTLIDRYDEDQWSESISEDIANGLIFAEKYSAPGFRAAINNHVQSEWDAGLSEVIDVRAVQDMASRMMGKVPQERVFWQFLVDECCSTTSEYSMGPEYEEEAEEKMPKEFLLRCMRRFRELVKTPQQGKEQERCYLEHWSAKEKNACSGLHMRYDEATRHGYFE